MPQDIKTVINVTNGAMLCPFKVTVANLTSHRQTGRTESVCRFSLMVTLYYVATKKPALFRSCLAVLEKHNTREHSSAEETSSTSNKQSAE
jgi:hypothetical protein